MAFWLAHTFHSWFRPAIEAIFGRNLPFRYRWRLLLLQPISVLTYCISSFPWIFSRAFKVQYLPITPTRSLRVLVFKKPSPAPSTKLRPLHIDVHGGAFLGGLPESGAYFCHRLAEQTGAVVISVSYRYAPVHTFPAAIDDVDNILRYLRDHAEQQFGADPKLLSVSGFSAGANLVLAASQQPEFHVAASTGIKASVTFYAPVDLRLKPEQKQAPPNYPTKDPLAFLLPLFDSYASPSRSENLENPRLNPIVARMETLPENMLFIVPTIDILMYEQLTFIERLQQEVAKDPKQSGRRIESMMFEGQIHGFLELPSGVVDKKVKDRAFDAGVAFIKDVHRKYGFEWK